MKGALLTSILILFSLSSVLHAQDSNPFDNCLYLDQTVCIQSRNTIIPEDNNPSNLIGLWTFDDRFAADYSGQRNTMVPAPSVGPAVGGKGQSAYFNSTYYSEIGHIKAYESNEFSLSFWIFLIEGPTDGWRTIISKGTTSQELTPSIYLWPQSTRLHVRVSTDQQWNDGLDSNSYLQYQKWTYISITYSHGLVQLYIDGMLDQQAIIKGGIRINKGPFHVGADPWHSGAIFYMDSLKFYNTALKQSYLMGEASKPLFTANNGFYAILACDSCNYGQAENFCQEEEGYHLCSMQELYSGGYQTARALGWFNNNKDIWFRPTGMSKSIADGEDRTDPNVYKLGVCCSI